MTTAMPSRVRPGPSPHGSGGPNGSGAGAARLDSRCSRRVFRPGRDLHRGGVAGRRPTSRRAPGAVRLGSRSIAAVERGDADAGVVPIENMIEGSVSVTLDTLAFESELLIQREIDLPVSLNLCAQPGVALADVRTVVSFPHALAQCRGWLAKKLPAAEARSSHSTSDAAREVSRSKRRDLAAICNTLAAELLRPRRAGHRRGGPSRERDPLRARGPRHPRADRARQDVDRVLPAQGPSGLAARDPPGVRSPRREPHQGGVVARRSSGLGDYCFFIDCEGMSPTSWWPTRSATCGQARRGEVPRLVPGRRSGGGRAPSAAGHRRAAEEAAAGGSRPSPRRSGTRELIDLKRLRDEPEYRRGIERKRVRAGLIDEVLAVDETQRALATRSRRCGRARTRPSKEIGKAAAPTAPAKIEIAAKLKEELAAEEQVLQDADARLRELRVVDSRPRRRVGARRRRRRRRRDQEGRAPLAPRRARPRRVRRGDRLRRHRARGRGERLALRLHHGRGGAARARARQLRDGRWSSRTASRRWSRPRSCASARWRRPASSRPTARRSYDVDDGDLFLVGTSEVPLSALHRWRHVHSRRVAHRATPGYSSCFRREAGTYGKDTARHLPRAPVRQGRDVLVLRARRVVGRARAHPRDRGADHRRPRPAVPRGRTSRPAISARPRRRSSTSRRGCRRKGRTASSPRARTTPTTPLAGSARG